jgi:hypothetical protein
VHDVKPFLEFAERGAKALAAAAVPLDREAEADFERRADCP